MCRGVGKGVWLKAPEVIPAVLFDYNADCYAQNTGLYAPRMREETQGCMAKGLKLCGRLCALVIVVFAAHGLWNQHHPDVAFPSSEEIQYIQYLLVLGSVLALLCGWVIFGTL